MSEGLKTKMVIWCHLYGVKNLYSKNIGNISKIKLRRVILETIAEGSTTYSDMWPVADRAILGNSSKFKHGSVNHTMNCVN
jgi:hypothetical protein